MFRTFMNCDHRDPVTEFTIDSGTKAHILPATRRYSKYNTTNPPLEEAT